MANNRTKIAVAGMDHGHVYGIGQFRVKIWKSTGKQGIPMQLIAQQFATVPHKQIVKKPLR